jgi:hypothetical protein
VNKPKPSIPEVIEDFRAYFAEPGNGAWGSLHIVLDDGNVADHSVAFCVEWSKERGDAEGERLANILLRMSQTQRRKIAGIV